MSLSKQQLKFLKKESHALKSIYQIGKLGLTENFVQQIDQALERHELIKFNILQNSMEEIKDAANHVAQIVGAEIVQTIGHTATLYRPSSKEKYQTISSKVGKI